MGSKQTQILRIGGIVMGKAPGDTPDGSQHIASCNLIMQELGRLRSRRGLERVLRTSIQDRIFCFDGQQFYRSEGGALTRLNAGVLSGIGSAPDINYRRPQAAQAGDRLFITSGYGLQVVDDGQAPYSRPAGGVDAPGFASAATSAVVGWMSPNYQVAYRYTIGIVTDQGVQLIGPPSPRVVVQNTAGVVRTVNLTLRIPDPNYGQVWSQLQPEQVFIQVWRSRQVPLAYEPDDDLRLVYERFVTQSELTNGVTATIEDVVPGDPPDDLRGEYLYTNPNSGEGIDQANDRPPYAELVATHKNRLWLGCTTQPQEAYFKLLAVGGVAGLQNTDRLMIAGSQTLIYEAGLDFTVSLAGSASQNIRNTAESLVRAINADATNTSVWAALVSSPDDPVGEIQLRYRTPYDQAPFKLWTLQRSGAGAWTSPTSFAPQIPPLFQAPAVTFSLQRVANVVTATVSAGTITNALKVGQRVLVSGGADPSPTFGLGPHVITGLTATTFTYAEVGANAGPFAGVGFTVLEDEWFYSESESKQNRIHYSKPSEFEAFPRNNFLDIGAASKRIIAMLGTRDTFWIWKEDGLYRLTGDDESTFEVERMDVTVIAVSPDCVKPFAESIVAWTTKGVVLVSESNFEVISDDVDPLLRMWLRDEGVRAVAGTPYVQDCFMVVDDREQTIRLHLRGSSKTEDETVTGAGEALVYAMKTRTWARWEWESKEGLRWLKPLKFGVVDPVDGAALYVCGFFSVGGEGCLWKERQQQTADTFVDDDEDGLKMVMTRRAVWNYASERAPMRDKRFDELTVLCDKWYDNNPSEMALPSPFSAGFATELTGDNGAGAFFFGVSQPSFWPLLTYAATPVDVATRFAVPMAYARGQRLWIAVQNTTFQTDFIIDGYSLLVEVLNTAITR